MCVCGWGKAVREFVRTEKEVRVGSSWQRKRTGNYMSGCCLPRVDLGQEGIYMSAPSADNPEFRVVDMVTRPYSTCLIYIH